MNRGRRLPRHESPPPSLEPSQVVEQAGLRAEVYEVEFRAGFRTRLAMLRAWFWGRLGADARAARAAREVIPALPRSPWLGVWAGQMLAKHGGREEACAVFCELQGLAPGHLDSYATLGRYLLSVGRPARAVEFLEEAIRLGPSDHALQADHREALRRAGAAARGSA